MSARVGAAGSAAGNSRRARRVAARRARARRSAHVSDTPAPFARWAVSVYARAEGRFPERLVRTWVAEATEDEIRKLVWALGSEGRIEYSRVG